MSRHSLVMKDIVARFAWALPVLVVLGLAVVSPARAELVTDFRFNSGTSDSVLGIPGTISGGTGGSVAGGQLVLAGALGTGGPYLSVGSGINSVFSGLTGNYSFESWATVSTIQTWARIFDFGNNSGGPYIYLSPNASSSPGVVRFAITTAGGGGEQPIISSGSLSAGVQHYLAVSVQQTSPGVYTGTLYVDGAFAGSNTNMTLTPAALGINTTTNDFIGRSQYGDPTLNGSVNELRIWNHALSSAEVTAHNAAGANGLAIWNGSGEFNTDLANWDLGAAPTGGTMAYINGGSLAINSPTTFTGGISIHGGTTTVSATSSLGSNVSGNNVIVSGGNLVLGSASNIGANQGLALTGGALDTQGWALSVASLSLTAGTLTSAGGGSLSASGSAGFDVQSGLISGNLAGTGGMVKTTTGTVVLSGSNSYGGGTQVNYGVLQFANSNAVPASGSITVNRNGIVTTSAGYPINSLLGAGAVATASSGVVALNSSSTDTNVNFTAGAGYNALLLGSIGSVTYGGTITPGTNGYLFGNGQGLGGTLTLLSPLSGANNLTANGPGTVVLAAAPGYTGSTTLAGGVLDLGGNTFSTTATVTVSAGTLQNGTINSSGSYAGQAGTVSAILGGSAALTKTTAGTLVLSNTGNSYSGGTTLSGGVVNFARGALGTTGSITPNGGTLQWAAGNTQDLSARFAPIPIGQNAILDTNANNVAFAGGLNGSGGLTKLGAGLLSIGGSSTYSGISTVTAGTLAAGVPQAFGTNGTAAALTLNGGVADLASDASINPYNTTVSAASTILSDRATANAPGITHTLGNLSINASVLTIDKGANVIHGPPAVAFGAATLTGAATINTNATVSTTLASIAGGVNGLTIGGAGNTTVVGNAVNGTLNKNGAGTLTLTGSMAITGSSLLHAGTLLLSNGTLTTSAFSSFGQTTGDNAIVTAQGNSRIVVTGDLNVGDVNTSIGTLNVRDNSFVQGTVLYVGKTNTSVGVLNLSGGTVQSTGGDNRVGANTTTAYGVVNMSGGRLNFVNNTQFGATGMGVMNQSGGVVTSSGGYPVVGRFAGGVGLYNMSAGSLNVTANDLIVAEAGIGTFNVGGSAAVDLTNNMFVGWVAGGLGTVNLSGGTITAPALQQGGGTAAINFHGGTLRARAASATFLPAFTGGAYVYPGGAVIDTQSFAVTIPATLLAPTGYGVGSVTINNAGAGYKGEPIVTITGGTSGGRGATARAIVNAGGAITGIVITNPGSGYGAGDVLTATLAGGGATTAGTLGTITLAPNSSAGGLTKLSAGTLTLGNGNTYGGLTRIMGGVLVLGHTGALSNSTLDYNGYGGTVNFGALTSATFGGLSGSQSLALPGSFVLRVGANNSTYTGVLSGTASLTKIGSGTLVLANSNTYSNGTAINAGTLGFASGGLSTTGAITFGGGSLQWAGANTEDVSARFAAIPSGIAAGFDTNGNSVTLASAVTGSGSVAKQGLGILTLGNVGNSYTGGSTVSGGVLQFSAGALPATGNVTINAGGGLAASGPYGNVTDWLNSGRVAASSSGAVAVSGTNVEVIDLTTAGAGAYTQLSLAAAGNATYSGTLTPASGQPYRFGGAGGNLTVTSDLTSGTSNLVVSGPGVTLLTSTNNNFGTTTVTSGGSLDVQSYLGPNPGVFTANQLSLNNGTLLGTTSLAWPNSNAGIALGSGGGAFVATAGNTLTVPVVISGTGALTTGGQGTVAFSAANSYQGATLISGAGTASIQGSGLLGSTGGATTIGASSGDNPTVSLASSTGTLTGSAITVGNTTGSQGTVNQSAGLVTSNGNVLIGSSGTAVYNLSGGSLLGGSGAYSAGTQIQLGAGAGGAGTINVSGTALLKTNSTSNLRLGTNAAGQGTIVQSGASTVSVGGDLLVGDSGIGSYTLDGGTLVTAANLAAASGQLAVLLGSSPGASGAFVQNGGLITTANNLAAIGYATGSTGSYTIHGGTLNTGDVRTDSGTGNYYQDGGNVNVAFWLRTGVNAGSVANYTIVGGTTTVGPNIGNTVNVYAGENGTGTLTVGGSNGGTLVVLSGTGNNLTVASGATAAGTLNLQPNGLLITPSVLKGAGSATFNWSGGTLQNASGGSLNVTMPAVFSGSDHTLWIDADRTGTFAAAAGISGTGNLLKVGGGTLNLGGYNTYSGATTVNGGVLLFNYIGSVPPGSVTVNSGATVALNAPGLHTWLLGHVAPSSSGVVALTTANAAEAVNFNSAGLAAASLGALGTVNYTGSHTPFATTYRLGGGGGTLVFAASQTLTDVGMTVYDAVIGGNVTLLGSNTYTGPTTINSGTLQIGSGGTGAYLASPTVVNNGGLYFNHADPISFGSAVSGGGVLVKAGSGTLTFTNTASSYSGGTRINGGVLAIDSDLELGATGGSLSFNGGTLRTVTTGISSSRSVSLAGAGTIDTNGLDSMMSGPFSGAGGLTKTGLGSLTLSGTNNYTGATTVNAGVLAFTGSTNTGAGAVLVTGGTLTVLGTGSLASTPTIKIGNGAGTTGTVVLSNTAVLQTGGEFWLGQGAGASSSMTISDNARVTSGFWFVVGRNGGTGVLTMNGGTVQKNGAGNVIIGSLGGNGTWYHNGGSIVNNAGIVLGETSNVGTLYLSGGSAQATWVQTWGATGYLYLDGGTLQPTADSADFATGNLSLLVRNGAILDTAGRTIAITRGLTHDGAGPVTDGGLTKRGAGMLTLAGSNTYNGATAINSGTLQIGNGGAGQALASSSISNSGALIFNHTNAMTYAGVIGGSGSLTKLGAGITTLAGSNTFATTVDIRAGGIGVTADASLGSASNVVAFNGNGTLQFAAPAELGAARSIDIGVTYTGTLDALAGSGTVASSIGGLGSLAMAGTGTVTLTNTTNSYSGGTRFNGGVLAVDSDLELGGLAGGLVFNGGTLRTVNTGIASARPVAMTGAGTIDTNGLDSTLAGTFSGGGALTKLGLGTLSLTASNNSVTGAVNVRAGNLLLPSGAGFTTTALTSVGDVSGSSGLLTVQPGATLTTNNLYVGSTGTAIGIVNQNGGLITRTGGNTEWRIGGSGGGGDAGAKGTFNVSGGSVVLGTTNFQVGSYGQGWLNQSGGVVSVTYWPALGRFAGGVGRANITGGTFYQLGATEGFIIGEFGAGELTLSGSGTLDTVGGVHFNQNAPSTGNVNLGAGGTIISSSVSRINAGGTGTFHFNGGTLRAKSSTATFLQGLTAAYVDGGGAVIDDAGQSVTIAQNLLAPAANGVTAFTSLVSGSGYIAPPLVTVSAPDVGGVQATAYTTIDSAGNVTGIVIGNPGSGYSTTPTFTIIPAPGDTTGSGASATAVVSANTGGGLTKTGSGTLTLSGANTYAGGTTISGGFLKLGNAAALGAATGGLAINGGTLDLNSVSPTVGSLSGNAAALVYDTGAGTTASLTVNSAVASTYAGVIGNEGGRLLSLVKTGSQSLVLTGLNTYKGGTTITGGVLEISSNANLGNATGGLTFNGGTLRISGSDEVDTNRATTLGAAGGTFEVTTSNSGGSVFLDVISGSGGLTKTGSGLLELDGANTYQGGTAINAGTLLVTASGNLGTGDISFGGTGNGILNIAGTSAFDMAKTLTLTSTGTVRQSNSGGATLSGLVTGGGALIKTGSGTLILSGTANDFSGGTVVQDGTLTLANAGAIDDGTSLTVGDLSAFSAPVVPGAAVPTPPVAPVPEPGTLTLVLTGLIGYTIWRRRKA